MPASKINGFSVAYTALGGILLWSGIKGTTISATFTSLLQGKAPSAGTENIDTTEGNATAVASGIGALGSDATAASGSGFSNELTVAKYLVSNGYSKAAAAGVAACVAGESSGNPEAEEAGGGGGRGLIQWTGDYNIPITGNATADLDAQLPLIIQYNNAQGSGLVAMLNAQTNPVSAADFYSQHFERPAVTDSDVSDAVATAVYADLIASGSASSTTSITGNNPSELAG